MDNHQLVSRHGTPFPETIEKDRSLALVSSGYTPEVVRQDAGDFAIIYNSNIEHKLRISADL